LHVCLAVGSYDLGVPGRRSPSHRAQATGLLTEEVIRVAVDATPLLGRRTGIGHLVAGLLTAIETRPDLEVHRYAVTARGRSAAGARRQVPVPARLVHHLWQRGSMPPGEWVTGSVDVVHGTNYVVPPTRRAARIVSVHDLVSLDHPDWVAEPSRRFPDMIRRAVSEGAWVHCDSHYVADRVHQWLETDRVRVIYPGLRPSPHVITGWVSSSTSRSGSWRAKNNDIATVVAIGTVEPRKDYPTLIDAFGLLMQSTRQAMQLIIAGGTGWGRAGDAVRRALAQQPTDVQAAIRLAGYISDDEREELLASATVLCYPSLDEGFGFPPLEAMQAGVPVVATNVGSLPEVLGSAARFIPVQDTEALAAALREVISNESVRVSMQSAGFEQVQRYRWDVAAAEFVDLYRCAYRERPERAASSRRTAQGQVSA
jgi:glycosyltransferase involved in cell wall biosynthesis